MTKYRIDFSRLARSEEEIFNHKVTKDFLYSISKDNQRVLEKHDEFFDNYLPDGHIVDSVRIEDCQDLNGKQVFDKHIKKRYPESKFLSWDHV